MCFWNVYISEISEFWTGIFVISVIIDYFRQGLWTLFSGKFFGKFRETFGGPKPLFIFEKFSTVEKPGLSIIAKIFGQRSALLQIDSSSPLSLILSFVFYVSFEICLR